MLLDILRDFSAFFELTAFHLVTWRMIVMWGVCGLLFYLAVGRGFEPLLLVPIAFGALLANLPTQGMITQLTLPGGHFDTGSLAFAVEPEGNLFRLRHVAGGLYDFITQGVKLEIFPPLIFLGVGALTDFGPLIANPRTLLLGAAAQLGVLITFLGANALDFTSPQAASIGIIGGADGPTAIFVATKLAPELLGAVAVAAYTYMALVPLIQPPIMRALTTPEERLIRMKSLRRVSRTEKLVFALLVTVLTTLLVPAASPLIGMLMLGNFLRECGVTERLMKSAQNEIINVVTILLGTSVGMTMAGDNFLRSQTLMIIALGVVAFGFGTAGGVLAAKIMNLIPGTARINPLIGSAGVSAVPMAARVSQVEGQRADPGNHLLMHAMGPNVAGVIGTAVLAGYYLATLPR